MTAKLETMLCQGGTTALAAYLAQAAVHANDEPTPARIYQPFVMRGLSTTHVPSLGNFVSEFALAQGQSTFGLLILCGPETKAADFMGNEVDCEFDVANAFPDLIAHVDAKTPTLFDLRRWKDRPRQWAHLSPEVRTMIRAYDALLFVPGGKPAQPLRP